MSYIPESHTTPIRVKGRTDFIKQINSQSFTWQKGDVRYYTDEWLGQNADADAFVSGLQVMGYINIRVDRGNPCKITASYPETLFGDGAGDTDAINDATWELEYVEYEQKVELNPLFSAIENLQGLIAQLKYDMEENLLVDKTTHVPKDYTDDFGDLANALRDCRLMGIDAYTDYYRVVRRTIKTHRNTLIQAQDNMFKFENNGVTDIPMPSWFKRVARLGDDYAPRLYSYPYAVGSGIGQYVGERGWLRKAPKFSRISNTKYSLSQEWWEVGRNPFLYSKIDVADPTTYAEGLAQIN